ncbi:MAG TPA: glycosyltransferase [Gammaproteobacteria bacterium]|nr:glycosyltransferase [Gammaproteobacteria bacterium]
MKAIITAKAKNAVRLVGEEGLTRFAGKVIARYGVNPLMRAVYAPAYRRFPNLLNRQPETVYVILSTVDWAFRYRQRPQHLAVELANSGAIAIYVNPPNSSERERGPREIQPRLYVVSGASTLLKTLRPSKVMILSTDNSIDNSDIDQWLARGHELIYDYIDEVSEQISRRSVSRQRWELHRRLLGGSDARVVVSATDLQADAESNGCSSLVLIENGVDVAHFQEAELVQTKLSARFVDLIQRGNPIVGYYGALAAWLDYDLILECAAARPQYEFVLIGPDYDESVPDAMKTQPNVHILPPVDYSQIAGYGARFNVALIPFLVNSLTEAVSPIKLFEYLALGKPVVSTAITESRKYDCVYVSGRDGFCSAIDQAVATENDAASVRARRATADANTWRARVDVLRHFVEET